jgi:hypothetical protein
MGCGSGMTCWRRLREWQESGVWQRLYELLLAKLNEAELTTGHGRRSTARMCGRLGAEKTGPSPVDRSRRGSKHHLIACGRGTPLTVSLTGGNRNDISEMIPPVDAIPPVRGGRARPRRRPQRLLATAPTTHASVAASCAAATSRRNRRSEEPAPLRTREAALGGRAHDRLATPVSGGLRIRCERREHIHEAFLAIGCSLICLKLLNAETSLR